MSRLGYSLVGLVLLFSTRTLAQLPFSEEHFAFVKDLSISFEREELSSIQDETEEWTKWKTVSNYTFGKDRGSMAMITELNSLHPYFRDQIIELIRQCKAKGIELAVVEAYRTPSKQNEYRSMGKKYTRSSGGFSKHQYGLAIDVVPIVDSVAEWHNVALWKKVGTVGERLGLRWGGRWRHPYDPGHFEWTNGLSGYQLAQGIFPPAPTSKQENYPCMEEDLKRLMAYWKSWETEQSAISRKESSTRKMK
ncbi:MAG TPA: M15 family metallopeptidase [Cyclobacteriaceae bacterium]